MSNKQKRQQQTEQPTTSNASADDDVSRTVEQPNLSEAETQAMKFAELAAYLEQTTFGKADKQMRSNSVYTFRGLRNGKLVWYYPGKNEEMMVDPDAGSFANRFRAMIFGIKQRIQDGGAVLADEKTGKVDPDEKWEEMKRVAVAWNSGTTDWSLKPQAGATGPASYVTKALVALKTYMGQDVSDAEKANAFVKDLAENPKFAQYKFGGQVGKVRTWLEANSKVIREKVAEIRAAEATQVDADAELAKMLKAAEQPLPEIDENEEMDEQDEEQPAE